MLMLVLAVEFRLAEVALVLPVRRQPRSCPRYPQRSWHPCHTVATLEQSQDAAVSDVSQMRPATENEKTLFCPANSRSTKRGNTIVERETNETVRDRDRRLKKLRRDLSLVSGSCVSFSPILLQITTLALRFETADSFWRLIVRACFRKMINDCSFAIDFKV